MPVMIVEAILSGDDSPNEIEISVKMVEPKQIMIMVRSPAALLRYSRSIPIAVPMTNEITSCNAVSLCSSIDLMRYDVW
jgi:hypothetical protein